MQEKTRAFLETLFAPYTTEGEGERGKRNGEDVADIGPIPAFVEIRCLTAALGTEERSVPRRWFPLTQIGRDAAAAWAVRQAADWNVYYGVLPRTKPGGGGGTEAVDRAAWLWCDIDHAPTWEDAQLLLEPANLPAPALAIGSGNGCHVYWPLAQPFCLPDTDSKARFRSLLRRVCLAIGDGPTRPMRTGPARTQPASCACRVRSTGNNRRTRSASRFCIATGTRPACRRRNGRGGSRLNR